MLRITAGAALACAALIAAAPAAGACSKPKAPAPLKLASYKVVVVGTSKSTFTYCDYGATNCGFVGVQATFSGLKGRDHTGDPNSPNDGDLVGSIRVTRVYGCADSAGKRLHRYDKSVTETDRMDTRENSGYRIPEKGNTLEADTYAFLGDAQPHNCPKHTTATVYKIVASHARIKIESAVPKVIPNHTYRAPRVGRWVGAVAAP